MSFPVSQMLMGNEFAIPSMNYSNPEGGITTFIRLLMFLDFVTNKRNITEAEYQPLALSPNYLFCHFVNTLDKLMQYVGNAFKECIIHSKACRLGLLDDLV